VNGAVCYTLAQLAERFALDLGGDASHEIRRVATLAQAGPDALAFLANPRYRRELAQTGAGAVLLHPDEATHYTGNALLSRNPYADYARIAALFDAPVAAPAGIHPSAVVDPSAEVDPTASIGPLVAIGARSRIHAGVTIGAGSVIGEDCEVGPGSRLVARVTLVLRVRLGRRVLVHPGAVLGADGFGLAQDRGHWLKVPQLGGVLVGDDCEIGANTTIDRGALDDTVLEDDVRLDNQIQIGHNVVIGAHTAMAGCSAVAGSTRIGRQCLIAGGVGIAGHLRIGDRVTLTAMSLVTRSIEGPGEYSSGLPIQDSRTWRRNAARFRQLDDLARQLKPRRKDTMPNE
jgi:UDP-3-O-[3-hydroxymyristoyl] glucosamine N-acyltransferase